jgi:hypothetical protein
MSRSSHHARPWEALPGWGRRAITGWLLFHLFAIFIAPASVAPASDLARAGWNVCRPYLQVLYLNHGYHFFAPDPGESTLLAFSVETSDGRLVDDVIPHRRIQPRLLYHRHFMLTESLAFVAAVSERENRLLQETTSQQGGLSPTSRIAESASPPLTAPVDGAADLQQPPSATMPGPEPPPAGLLRDWYESYARCILERYDGQRVRLTRVVHFLPPIEMMQQSIALGEPLTLSEPQSFAEFPVGTFDRTRRPLKIDNQSMPGSPSRGPATDGPSDLVQAPATSGAQP